MGTNANVAEFMRTSARRTPDDIALVDGAESWTWSELDERVDHLAAGLVHAGVRVGDRVAIQQGNTRWFVVSYFAVLRAGAVAVPVNPALTAAETAILLTHCGARLVLCDSGSAPTATAAADAVGSCEVVTADSGDWRSILAHGRRMAFVEAVTPGDALAVIMFTAGSGASAKGAMLTHAALRTNVELLLALEGPAAVRADDRVLVVVPTFHIYGLNAVLTLAIAAGARSVLLDRFDPVEALTVIRDQSVSVVAGTPAMFLAWSRLPELGAGFGTMRLFTCGGSSLPPGVLEEFTSRAGIGIYEGYGMTEAGPVVTTTLVSGLPKAGSVGRALPGVEVMLVDGFGDRVAEGDPGEVCVRSPSLFSGYWPHGAGGPDAQGWFRSGDVAFLDADHDLHVVDRRREVIVVNGFTVYPREVESVIEAMPEVAEAAVIAIADERSSEAVMALVVPRPGAVLTAVDVQGHCAQILARFKCPTRIRIVETLPHSSTGTIAKGRLGEVHGDMGSATATPMGSAP